MKLELFIYGLGHIPGKKNSKMIIPAKGKRRPMLITDPKIQKTCRKIEVDFVSQLSSVFQTGDAAISPTARKQSLMRSLPRDDCWTEIPIVILSAVQCKKGEEGCSVIIEPI